MENEEFKMNLDDARAAADRVSAENDADVFFYNGTITRANVLAVMDEIQSKKSRKQMLLLLVTYGGDPHAAFKISRYIQDNYDRFSLFVPGFCKSAGTLFAIAANEVIFAPFGELGPLDMQMAKPDQFQFDSGLVIGESLDTLERRASQTFKRMFNEIMAEQQGLISVSSALHAASEITKAVYAPIMARIDPEEVGVRQRALRIALDYGSRLSVKSQNAEPRAIRLLAEKYSSHAFVIDRQEAGLLFRAVRAASQSEMALCHALRADARIERSEVQPTFTVLSKPAAVAPAVGSEDESQKGTNHGEDQRTRGKAPAGGDSVGTNGATVLATKHVSRGAGRSVRTRNAKNGGAEPAPQ